MSLQLYYKNRQQSTLKGESMSMWCVTIVQVYMHQHTFDIAWDVLRSNAFGCWLLFLIAAAFLYYIIVNCRLSFLFIWFAALIFYFCFLLQISTKKNNEVFT